MTETDGQADAQEYVCADCDRRYTADELPKGEGVKPDRCPACNAYVWAVGPINGDGPFLVGETERDLAKLDGFQWDGGEQCEDCGCSKYTYNDRNRLMVCGTCGHAYKVRQKRAYDVVFP